MPELTVELLQESSIIEGEIAVAVRVVETAREEVLKERVEVAACIVVEAVDVATTGDDEEVDVLDEEACIRSVDAEEDVVLEVDSAADDEAVASEEVADEDVAV
jgi:hypothetical protein